MERIPRGAWLALGAAVLVGIFAFALSDCGGDDEPDLDPVERPAPEQSEDAGEDEDSSQEDEPTDENEPSTGGTGGSTGDGGSGSGGGDDPFSGEGGAPPVEPGGSGSGGNSGSGGGDPTDQFEQFCQENPDACAN